MKYQVYFYRTKTGRCQSCDYARAMNIQHQAKSKRWFQALAKMGPDLPEDYGKHLQDGVWELRVILQHHQHRFFYSFWKNIIVVTNAFLKKSRVLPKAEIEKSRKAMADWISRKGWEDL
ncbi:MAG: hypothetical protein COB53_03625 [Elusimicrobia bacterium]|nr:MAG: hypothetical protein COB53_03625 [Elusimicrobiota bacterium]